MSDVLKNVNPSEGVEVVPFETTTSNNVVGHPDQDVESNNDNDHASSSFDVNPSNKNEKNRLFSLTKKVTTGLGFLLVIGAAAVAGASMSAANNSNIQAQQSQSATTAMPGGNGGSGKAGKCNSAAVEGVYYGEGKAMNLGALKAFDSTVDLKATMCMEPYGDDGVLVFVCNQSCDTGYQSSAEMYGMIGKDLLEEDECVMDVVEIWGAGTYKFRVDTGKGRDDLSISYVLTQPADFYKDDAYLTDNFDHSERKRSLEGRRLYPDAYPAAVARNTLHPIPYGPQRRNLENCNSDSPCDCFLCSDMCGTD